MIETLAIAYYGLGAIVGVGCLIYTFAQKGKEPKEPKESKNDSYYLKELKKKSKQRDFDLCNYCVHNIYLYKKETGGIAMGFNCDTNKVIHSRTSCSYYVKHCQEFELDKSKF